MKQKLQSLTKEQFNILETLHYNKDRTGFYIKYYEFTGCDQALEQAKISSFSGFLGGTAKIANELIQSSEHNYPKEGVKEFSRQIQSKIFDTVKLSYMKGEGGILNDLQMVQIAQHVWQEKGIKGLFPGNIEVALEQMWQKNPSDIYDNVVNKGTAYGTAAAFIQIITLGKLAGSKEYDYEKYSEQYQRYVTPDFKAIYYTERATGKSVYVEETGAQPLSGGFVQVTGISAEQVAEKFNVPIEWVVENEYLETEAIRHGVSKKFTIITQSKVEGSWEWASGLFDVYNDISRMFSAEFNKATSGSNKHPNSKFYSQIKDSIYEIKPGDTLWDIAQSYGTTVETILLLPGNEKYLDRMKLGKNGEVQHVLIKAGENLVLPKPNSKLYAGNFKEKLQEMFGKDTQPELRGIEVKTNKDGRVVTEIEEGAGIKVENEVLSADELMEVIVREKEEQTDFLFDNFINVDESVSNIHKFTEKVYGKLFDQENAAATGRTIAERLVNGDKIEVIAEDLLRRSTSETIVEGVSLPTIAAQYEKVFNNVGKDIITEFAISILAQSGRDLGAREYRIMAYSAASKVISKQCAEQFIASKNPIVHSAAAAAIAQAAISIISMKKIGKAEAMQLGVGGIAAYTGSYVSGTILSGMGVASGTGFALTGAGLLSGLVSGGIGAVIALGINSLIRGKKREVSTYIDSHFIRINEEGALEFITLRPAGTIVKALGPEDKYVFGRGNSDAILTGDGNDVIRLFGTSGGFVESGDNKPRQWIKAKDPVSGEEVETYIYFEKIFGSDGNDNKLDGQAGDDYINGKDGDDYIRGGSGDDLINGGKGKDVIIGEDGDDIISGDEDSDLMDGGGGKDLIYAGIGNDGTNELPIKGGTGDDIISGGEGNDIIDGEEGNDSVSGDEGDDILSGSGGSDFIYGGKGEDQIYGGADNDKLEGGADDDIMLGGLGNDDINGEEGDDILIGEEGDDLISGELGDDSITGGKGNDILRGGSGNDVYSYHVEEQASDNCANGNTLYQGDGNDIIEDIASEQDKLIIENIGIKPQDVRFQIQNNDLMIGFVGRNGSITVRNFVNSRGIDNIQLYGYSLNTKDIDLNNISSPQKWQQELAFEGILNSANDIEAFQKQNMQWAASYFNEEQFYQLSRNIKTNDIQAIRIKKTERFCGFKTNVYYVTHPYYPARMDGDGSNNKLIGNYWNEHILGHDGDDEIYGNNGNDYIQGGNGNDNIEGGNGSDTIFGEQGNDKLKGGAENDIIYGNEGNDTILGEEGQDKLFGGNDADYIEGGAGNDEVHGENDEDIVLGGQGDDKVFGEQGDDKLGGGKGRDKIHGGEGDDIIVGNEESDILRGEAGNDQIFGGEGDDEIYGDEGDDYLLGGIGNDKIYGGDGNDRIIGGFDEGNANQCKKFDDIRQKLELENFCAKYPGSSNNERKFLYGNGGNDYIRGSSGDDYIEGGEGDDSIFGGPGNDILKGGSDNDIIFGGEGDDHLYAEEPYTILGMQPKSQFLIGGAGKDIYYYNEKDGYVEIDDCGSIDEQCSYEEDVLQLGIGITVEDIIMTQEKADLKISFQNGWSGYISVKNQFAGKEHRIDILKFADGLELPIDNLLLGTQYRDNLIASNQKVVFSNAGDDHIEARGNQYTFGGLGEDTIEAFGDKNIHYGGHGSDIYIVSYNTTNSIIDELSAGDDNSVRLTEEVRIQNLFPYKGANSFSLNWRNGEICLTVHNKQGNLPISKIQTKAFSISLSNIADFKVLDSLQIIFRGSETSEWIFPTYNSTRAIYGGLGDDIIIGHPLRTNMLIGEGGNDIVVGNELNDSLEGCAGDDILYGDEGHDQLIGGAGDDILYGGVGKDYFIFQSGTRINQGKDRIHDLNCAEDSIELSAFGFGDPQYLPALLTNMEIDYQGNAVLKDEGKFHITLVRVKPINVTAECFTFGFAKIAAATKMHDFYNALPNVIAKLWLASAIKQLTQGNIKDWQDIQLPTLRELKVAFRDAEEDQKLLDGYKKIAYTMFQTVAQANLPDSFKQAYSGLYDIDYQIRLLPTSQEVPSEMLNSWHEAKQNFIYACNAYESSSLSSLSECYVHETLFPNPLQNEAM